MQTGVGPKILHFQQIFGFMLMLLAQAPAILSIRNDIPLSDLLHKFLSLVVL